MVDWRITPFPKFFKIGKKNRFLVSGKTMIILEKISKGKKIGKLIFTLRTRISLFCQSQTTIFFLSFFSKIANFFQISNPPFRLAKSEITTPPSFTWGEAGNVPCSATRIHTHVMPNCPTAPHTHTCTRTHVTFTHTRTPIYLSVIRTHSHTHTYCLVNLHSHLSCTHTLTDI